MESLLRQYAPFLARTLSSSSSPDYSPRAEYAPYSGNEKRSMEDEYTNFPLWAELSLSEKNPTYSTYSQQKHSTPRKNAAYLPRFQPQQQQKKSEYANFFCKECGCPLADRYGLHDLDDDDDWKEEYEACATNVQTREWARSLELLRITQQSSKSVMGKERRRPRHLPKIDTGVSNRYRTGLQHLA